MNTQRYYKIKSSTIPDLIIQVKKNHRFMRKVKGMVYYDLERGLHTEVEIAYSVLRQATPISSADFLTRVL